MSAQVQALEIVGLLNGLPSKPDAPTPVQEMRKMGAEALLAISATEDGRRELANAGAVKPLCALAYCGGSVARFALSALVNLTADGAAAPVKAWDDLRTHKLCECATDVVCEDDDRACTRLAVMCLANFTGVGDGARHLLDLADGGAAARARDAGDGDEADRPEAPTAAAPNEFGAVRRLLRRFFQTRREPERADTEDEADDAYAHVASVLRNLTQHEDGKKLILSQRSNLLAKLLPELDSRSRVRRRGVAGLVRNVCFDDDFHFFLLTQVPLVPHALYRLADASDEPLDADELAKLDPTLKRRLDQAGASKAREDDPETVLALLEAILALAQKRAGREQLRQMQVYHFMKHADLAFAGNEAINECCYEIANKLQRDEAPRPGEEAKAAPDPGPMIDGGGMMLGAVPDGEDSDADLEEELGGGVD